MRRTIQISKLEAARRQLETAITLYFQEGDEVSIHTLAFAAFQITRNICDKDGVEESFTKWVERTLSKEHRETIVKRIHVAPNFFKHADRDPKAVLNYVPDQIELIIRFGMSQYTRITGNTPALFNVYKSWSLMQHPEWYKGKLAPEVLDLIAEYPKNRPEYFKLARDVFQWAEQKGIVWRPTSGQV